MDKPVLYSYWRSSCSWRVRIVLHWKKIDYEYHAIHLVKDGGEQGKKEYLKINPMGQVPALSFGDSHLLSQSIAIMEFLEEKYPSNPLLPNDLLRRAKVRELVEMIASGIQPIQNLSVMKKVTDDPEQRQEWSRFWIDKGCRAVEEILKQTAGKCCVGDNVTLADCCLIPQIYNAKRFKVDLDQFPVIMRVAANLEDLDAFKAAHPSNQPDAQ